MNKYALRDCISINCISFTVVSVIWSLLAYLPDMMMPLTHTSYLELFACTTLISLLAYFSFQIPFSSQIFALLVLFLESVAVIFALGGGVFQWFPWKVGYILEVLAIIAAGFFITYCAMLWQNRKLAKAINEKIKERGHEQHH